MTIVHGRTLTGRRFHSFPEKRVRNAPFRVSEYRSRCQSRVNVLIVRNIANFARILLFFLFFARFRAAIQTGDNAIVDRNQR